MKEEKPKLQENNRNIVSDTEKRQLMESYLHTNPPAPLSKKPPHIHKTSQPKKGE